MLKRENLLEKGYSEEQVSELLNMFQLDRQGDIEKMNNLEVQKNKLETQNNELQSKFGKVNTELENIKISNMSEQEKIQKMLDDAKIVEERANQKEKLAQRIYNVAKAKEILSEYKLNDDLIETLVSDDEATTLANVNKWKIAIDNMNTSTAQKVREEISKIDVRPNPSNIPQEPDGMTKDKLQAMTLTEQKFWKDEHQKEYGELMQ